MNAPEQTTTTAAAEPSLNGTLADVAAFFRKSERTVKRWTRSGLGHWKRDGALVFGEDDVVKWWLTYHVEGRGVKPGEADGQARRLWREHMKVRNSECGVRSELQELQRRLGALEQLISGKELKAA